MPSTFLIAPVRELPADIWREVVDKLERVGWDVYWPARDTPQDDETGLGICLENRHAMAHRDAVHVIWDGESQGCLFDLGMAFALGKPIFVIKLPEKTKGKSFQNMISAAAVFRY